MQVDAQNSQGNTPLHVACLNSQDIVISELMGFGALVNATNHKGMVHYFTSCSSVLNTVIAGRPGNIYCSWKVRKIWSECEPIELCHQWCDKQLCHCLLGSFQSFTTWIIYT